MGRRVIEFRPLLGPGFHTMSLDRLHSLAVAGSPGQALRQELFAKLVGFVSELISLGIPCDLWIDGSFLTEADDPDDIDISVRVMDDVMDTLTTGQNAFLEAVRRDDRHYIAGLDVHVFAGYWIGHPMHGTEADDGYCVMLPSWGTQFGKGEDNWLKGIVVVPVMETDLGLRIRA